MTEPSGFAVTALWIYPVKDEPGISLSTAEIETVGLSGDRRKKAALHLVSAADADEIAPRANLVLAATPKQVDRLLTKRMTLGTSEIEITSKPKNCPGVYASVVRGGLVNIGDRLKPSAR